MASLAVALRTALEKLSTMDGFLGAAVISPDGEVLGSAKGDGWDMATTCGVAHNLFSAVRRTAKELAWGGVLQVDVATTSNSAIYLRAHQTPTMVLLILLVCKQETSKALVRLRMDQTLPEINAALNS